MNLRRLSPDQFVARLDHTESEAASFVLQTDDAADLAFARSLLMLRDRPPAPESLPWIRGMLSAAAGAAPSPALISPIQIGRAGSRSGALGWRLPWPSNPARGLGSPPVPRGHAFEVAALAAVVTVIAVSLGRMPMRTEPPHKRLPVPISASPTTAADRRAATSAAAIDPLVEPTATALTSRPIVSDEAYPPPAPPPPSATSSEPPPADLPTLAPTDEPRERPRATVAATAAEPAPYPGPAEPTGPAPRVTRIAPPPVPTVAPTERPTPRPSATGPFRPTPTLAIPLLTPAGTRPAPTTEATETAAGGPTAVPTARPTTGSVNSHLDWRVLR